MAEDEAAEAVEAAAPEGEAAAAEDEAAEAVEAAAPEGEAAAAVMVPAAAGNAAAAASDSHPLRVPRRPPGNADLQLAYFPK